MPNLLVFAPCERVIIEQGTNTVSLIGLLQGMSVEVPADLPKDALAPQQWFAFALWQREETDHGRRFQQRVTLESPGGRHVIDVLTDFEMSKDFHRNIGAIPGFPISESGVYTLRLAFREMSTETWTTAGAFPIPLIHTRAG